MNVERGENMIEKLSEGTSVLVVGLAVVFSVLIILMTVTYLFGVFFKRSAAEESPAPKQNNVSEEVEKPKASTLSFKPGFDTEDGELIAVISAAISSYVGTGSGNLRIRSIKKVD